MRRGRKRQYCDAVVNEMAQLYADGLKLREVAERMGVRIGTVEYLLKRARFERNRKTKIDRKSKQHEIVTKLANQGLRNPEIAKLVGLTPNWVSKLRHRLHLPGSPGDPDPATAQIRREIEELRHMTYEEIGLRLGVSKQRVQQIFRLIGEPRRYKARMEGDVDPE